MDLYSMIQDVVDAIAKFFSEQWDSITGGFGGFELSWFEDLFNMIKDFILGEV